MEGRRQLLRRGGRWTTKPSRRLDVPQPLTGCVAHRGLRGVLARGAGQAGRRRRNRRAALPVDPFCRHSEEEPTMSDVAMRAMVNDIPVPTFATTPGTPAP